MIDILKPSGIATLARENITLHTPLYTRVCHTFGRTLLRSLLGIRIVRSRGVGLPTELHT